MKKILIVVDYTNDFVEPNGALPVPCANKIAQNIQKQIDSKEYIAKIFTFDTHEPDTYKDSAEKNVFGFPIHSVFGTKGWNFYKIKPTSNDKFQKTISKMKKPFEMISFDNEFFFTKDVFNIWEGNNTYPQWFEKNFSKDEYEVDVVGVATNYCVFMNVMGMVKRGYKVNIIENSVAGITNQPNGDIDESYTKNIQIMKDNGINFISVNK